MTRSELWSHSAENQISPLFPCHQEWQPCFLKLKIAPVSSLTLSRLRFSRLSDLTTLDVTNWLRDIAASLGAKQTKHLPSAFITFLSMAEQQEVAAVSQTVPVLCPFLPYFYSPSGSIQEWQALWEHCLFVTSSPLKRTCWTLLYILPTEGILVLLGKHALIGFPEGNSNTSTES